MNFSKFFKASASLATFALAAMVSCEKPQDGPNTGNGDNGGNEVKPELELKNQILQNKDVIDIKSVLYNKEGDTWTFWLSPKEDLILESDIEATDDYLKAVAKNPTGNIDVKKDLVSIEYKGVTVKPSNLGDFKTVELKADAKEGKGSIKLDFFTLVENNKGNKVAAQFTGSAKAALKGVAKNSWQLNDNEPTSILSSVIATKINQGTEYYFYNEAGKTGPAVEGETAKYIKITVASDLTGNKFDLAEVDKTKLLIECDGVDVLNKATGFLQISEEKGTVNFALESRFDNKGVKSIFRAGYAGETKKVYASTGKFSVKHTAAFEKEISLDKVYHDASTATAYNIAFGLKTNTKEVVELMDPEARYAVYVSFKSEDVESGNMINLNADNQNGVTIKVYDYKNIETFDFIDAKMGETFTGVGTVLAEKIGDELYLNMNVSYGAGLPTINVDWQGKVTDVQTWPDLTPKKAEAGASGNNFIGKAKAGEDFTASKKFRKITGINVVKNDNNRLNGCNLKTYDITFTCEDGATFKLFYKQSDVNAGAINAGDRKNQYSDQAVDFLFKLDFTPIDKWGEWWWISSGQITNTWGYMSGVEEGTFNIANDGDKWTIDITFVNKMINWGMPSGDQENVKIFFDGVATK